MSIILRTNKGSALTYDEMDRNQSQFFYSSSLHNLNTRLRLHYTGSDSLDTATEDYGPTRYHEINLDPTEVVFPEAIAAGNNTEIQYNNNGNFGANSNFVFDYTHKVLGIGTAAPENGIRLDIHGSNAQQAAITLRGYTGGDSIQKHAKISFNEGSTLIGKIGRIGVDNSDLYIENNKNIGVAKPDYPKVHIGTGPDGAANTNVAATFTGRGISSRFGVNTQTPNRTGTFVGNSGIGISISDADTDQSFIAPIPSGIYNKLNDAGHRRLIPKDSATAGLLIASPHEANGGNIVVALHTDTEEKEGFNIINAFSGTNYSTSEVIFSAQVSGKVGINTNFPSDVGLTVAGNISGSGTLQVETLPSGSANNTSTLVATSTGLIQKIAAAPVPLGGIIMWSGTIANIPDGWTLCNGISSGYSINVPNLTDRFIVGASADGAGSNYPGLQGGAANDINAANAVLVAHTHTNTVGTNTPTITPTGTAAGPYVGNNIGGGFKGGDNNFKQRPFSANPLQPHTHSVNINTSGKNADGTYSLTQTGVNANLPPYYALAFIIYVGV